MVGLLQIHFCCSLLFLHDINDLENIWMWFAHNSLQLGVPAFDVVAGSTYVLLLTPRLKFKYAPYNIGVDFMGS